MTATTSVAAIGLGRMGGPMADHLIARGFDVRVYDPADAAMAPRVAGGATPAADPAAAADGASVVCVVVFDDAQALDVLAGHRGILETLAPGAVVAVHTTVTLTTIHELADRATEHEVVVLDAGISGGETGAADGTLLTMVGGPAEAVDRARPALDAFSKEVVHAGPLGAGMALKLARNAAGYAMMAAVHEAMELAHRSGVELSLLQHVIAETGVLPQALAPFMLGGPEPLPPDAPAKQRAGMEHLDLLAAKDLDSALDLAARLGADVPVIGTVRKTFRRVTRLD